MRSSIIETRSEDYITTARAKGLSDSRILDKHAFPNALLPMVTLIAINLGYVVAGAITAEVVFSWPGLGTLTVQALDARDYPLLQGIFLLIAVSVVVRQLRRGHRLRLPRPAGAGMSVTGIAGTGADAAAGPLDARRACARATSWASCSGGRTA